MAYIKDKMTTHHLYIHLEASFMTSFATSQLIREKSNPMGWPIAFRYASSRLRIMFSRRTARYLPYLPIEWNCSSCRVNWGGKNRKIRSNKKMNEKNSPDGDVAVCMSAQKLAESYASRYQCEKQNPTVLTNEQRRRGACLCAAKT